MKGIVFTLSTIFLVSAILILSTIYTNLTPSFSSIYTSDSIQDKVYYKFKAIERAVIKMLPQASSSGGINITIEEDGFNIITLSEVLPRITDDSEFNEDLDNFEKFAESKFNETNLVVDLFFEDIKCLPLAIQPYNISYTHQPATDCESGPDQTEVIIDPQDSWQYLNNYTFIFEPDGDISEATITGWTGPGCDEPNLGLNITIIGNDMTYGPNFTTTEFDRMCRFNINDIDCDAGLGFIKVRHNLNSRDDEKGVINIEVHPNCNVTSTVTLNLTDISGKVDVNLPEQSIKIKDTVFNFEKNDTVIIS